MTVSACARAFAALLMMTAVSRAQEVTLPLDAYEALRRRANPEPLPDPAPPAPFSLESAAFELRVGDESVELVQRLTLSIYGDGWHTIPLADAGSLTTIELGALEGRLTSGDQRSLVARGIGRHSLTLTSVVPLVEDSVAARPTRSLAFQLPPAGSVTAAVLPSADVDEVEIVSGGIARSAPGAERFELVGAPSSRLSLRLLGEDRAPDRAALPLRFDGDSVTMASLSRTSMSRTSLDVRASLEINVRQGVLDVLRVSVPSELEVTRLFPRELGWSRDGDVVTIRLQDPAEHRFKAAVFMTGETAPSFTAPLVVPIDAERNFLVTGLRVKSDGVPIVEDVGASRRADTKDLGDMWTPAARAFVVRDPMKLPRWSVEWSESAGSEVLSAQVDRLTVDTLVGDAGRAAYQFWAVVRSTGSLSLKVTLPSGFELVSARRDGASLIPGIDEDGRLEIPLVAGDAVQTIHVSGILPLVAPASDSPLEVPLPSMSIPVGRAEVRAVLRGDHTYRPSGAHIDLGMSTLDGAFDAPDGFRIVETSWTALSPSPEPLVLTAERVKTKKGKNKWY